MIYIFYFVVRALWCVDWSHDVWQSWTTLLTQSVSWLGQYRTVVCRHNGYCCHTATTLLLVLPECDWVTFGYWLLQIVCL